MPVGILRRMFRNGLLFQQAFAVQLTLYTRKPSSLLAKLSDLFPPLTEQKHFFCAPLYGFYEPDVATER